LPLLSTSNALFVQFQKRYGVCRLACELLTNKVVSILADLYCLLCFYNWHFSKSTSICFVLFLSLNCLAMYFSLSYYLLLISVCFIKGVDSVVWTRFNVYYIKGNEVHFRTAKREIGSKPFLVSLQSSSKIIFHVLNLFLCSANVSFRFFFILFVFLPFHLFIPSPSSHFCLSSFIPLYRQLWGR